MKIKNSNDKFKLSLLGPVAYGSVLLLSVLRCFQMVKFIDSTTGFFIGGAWLKVLLYSLFAIVCLAFIIISYFSSQSAKVEVLPFKNSVAGALGIVFSLALVYDFFASLGESAALLSGLSAGAFYNSKDAFKVLMASGTLPYAMQGFFAVFSAIYIVIVSKDFFKGSNSAYKHKILALAPICWSAFKIITRFVKQISYIKVSDLFLELIMLAFMILFFVTLSQVLSGVYSDDTRWRIPALGFSSAVIALSLNIPRLILTLFGGNFVNAEYPFSPADALFGLFAFAVSLIAIKSATSDKQPIDNTGVIN